MFVAGSDSCIIAANQAFSNTTGYDVAEVVGKNPRMFNSGRHDAEFFKEFWTTLQSKGIWQGEIWNRRKNGEIFPEWLRISTISNDRGEVTHYLSIFSDTLLMYLCTGLLSSYEKSVSSAL
jgi:PAS domain S-box-containing protein